MRPSVPLRFPVELRRPTLSPQSSIEQASFLPSAPYCSHGRSQEGSRLWSSTDQEIGRGRRRHIPKCVRLLPCCRLLLSHECPP
ncbi:hypothetical protein CSUI_001307 [Cystoisospora suis]|uniref:Uncharacterized protein n=1 Tax=Cystoisospora suis TaxID=483139 RepID=A0A2C6KLD5_9APIC|nr:hypothetical protein CSUI_001307 [Cystoisospora suis]